MRKKQKTQKTELTVRFATVVFVGVIPSPALEAAKVLTGAGSHNIRRTLSGAQIERIHKSQLRFWTYAYNTKFQNPLENHFSGSNRKSPFLPMSVAPQQTLFPVRVSYLQLYPVGQELLRAMLHVVGRCVAGSIKAASPMPQAARLNFCVKKSPENYTGTFKAYRQSCRSCCTDSGLRNCCHLCHTRSIQTEYRFSVARL